MPRTKHTPKVKEQLTVRLTEDCLDNLEAIIAFKGGTVTGVAQEILEATKTVSPQSFWQAVAAMQNAGEKKRAAEQATA